MNAVLDKIKFEYLSYFPSNNRTIVQKPIEICLDKDLLKKINRSIIIFEKNYDDNKKFDSILRILKSCDKIKILNILDTNKFKIIKF